MLERNYFAHETAVIDDGATIGEGTKIWHFSHVYSGAVIGSNCTLGQNVMVDSEVSIGDGCKVQNNVSLFRPVILERDVFCGPSCVFTNVKSPRAFVNRKNEFLLTTVKEGASIGANATIVCGVTLGRFCFIGAGALVASDVRDYALVLGLPARQRGWVCACGLCIAIDSASQSGSCSCGKSYLELGGTLREVEST